MMEGGRWRWTVDGGRWTVDGGRWTVDGGRWTVEDGGERREKREERREKRGGFAGIGRDEGGRRVEGPVVDMGDMISRD